MKKIVVLLICTFLSFAINAQNIVGAWENHSTSKNGDKLKNVVIFSNEYQVLVIYNEVTGKLIHTNGGTWKLEGDIMTEKIEFHSDNPELVGTEISFKVIITDDVIEIAGSNQKFNRIDHGKPGKLQGAWLMSGRIKNGKTQLHDINNPRKTMKILSGTRFQWIAYNTKTKQFIRTGGGTYTTINNKYTENIEFFSKDNSKAGLSLKFNFNLIDKKWKHTGLSSKGNPIHEIWSARD